MMEDEEDTSNQLQGGHSFNETCEVKELISLYESDMENEESIKRACYSFECRTLSEEEKYSLHSVRDLLRRSGNLKGLEYERYQKRLSDRRRRSNRHKKRMYPAPTHTSLPDGVLFLEAVKDIVNEKSEEVFVTWYNKHGNVSDQYTFGELWEEAGVIAYYLRNRWKIKVGDRAVLCYDFGLHFFASFLGCLRAGVVPVLVNPPAPPLSKSLCKIKKIVEESKPSVILTDSIIKLLQNVDGLNPISKSRRLWPKNASWRVTDNLSAKFMFEADEVATSSGLAFLQYTSGSTGDPKGVMVTHENLTCNINIQVECAYKAYIDSGEIPNEFIGFSWLHQHHNIGLVTCALTPFVMGWSMHMMSPATFLRNPLLWVDLMSRCCASWSVAPDFAYRLAARKFHEARGGVMDSHPISGLDLSCVRWMLNSTDPVRVDTRDLFTEAFGEYQLPDEYFAVSYCLTENVVAVCDVHLYQQSFSRKRGEKPLVASGDRRDLHASINMKIVDPISRCEVQDGVTGEIWLSGPSVASGYYKNKRLTSEVFQAKIENDGSETEYMRTGDLAFFQGDYLFVCGQIKDIVVNDGVIYFPQEIEFVVEDVSAAIRRGCIAAFSSDDAGGDGDLEIMFEVCKGEEEKASQLCHAIRASVTRNIGLPPSKVVAVQQGAIPKTSNFKVKRRESRTKLHFGDPKSIFVLSRSARTKKGLSGDKDDETEVEGEDDMDLIIDGIYTDVMGTDFEHDGNWKSIGLTSIKSVELRNAIADTLGVALTADAYDLHPTPDLLAAHVVATKSLNFPTDKYELKPSRSVMLPWFIASFLQLIGIVLILLLLALSLVPASAVGNLVIDSTMQKEINFDGRLLIWLWLPLAVPTFMVAFTLHMIIAKWLVIGCYRESEMPIPSIAYLRWWWFDRLVDFWEFWIGRFIKDTPLLWLTYILMGAKIHPSTKFDAFVREFDLVNIKRFAVIKHHIRCRAFGPWEEGHDGPTLRFRRIVIQERATIRGFLCPGVIVGEGSIVEKASVVSEGSRVHEGICAKGNPAFNSGRAKNVRAYYGGLKFDMVKVTWLIVELYLFFASILVGEIILKDNLGDWRYSGLSYWFLLIVISNILMLLFGIIIKWILIGYSRPGPYTNNFRHAVTDWIADYHFRISTSLLMSVTSNSRMWNVIMILFGMDIDFATTKIQAENFPPSQVDLVSIRRSFWSAASVDTERNSRYHQINVIDSNIGYNVHLCPGVNIARAIIAPLSMVEQSHCGERIPTVNNFDLMVQSIMVDLLYGAVIVLICVSFIPAYEVWHIFGPQNASGAVLVLPIAMVVQSMMWVLLLFILQAAAGVKGQGEVTPRRIAFLQVCTTISSSVQQWSILPLLWGTPFFNSLANFLGATIEGRVLYFGHSILDFPLVKMADQTIVDNSLITGHYTIFSQTKVGPDEVSGVLHDGSVAMANTKVSKSESGPCQVLITSPPKHARSSTPNTLICPPV